MFQAYDGIALDGGAEKVLSYVGALSALDARVLTQVRVVIGASAGALIGMMLCMRMSPGLIKETVCGLLSPTCDDAIASVDCDMFDDVWSSLGIANAEHIVGNHVRRILYDNIGCVNCTLAEFVKRTGVDFRVIVSDLTDVGPKIMSVQTRPDISMVRLLAMSACIPILFKPIVDVDNHVYVDGVLYGDLACRSRLNEQCPGLHIDRLLLMRVASNPAPVSNNVNMIEYIVLLFGGLLHQKQIANKQSKLCDNTTVIEIPFDADSNLTNRCAALDVSRAFSFLRLRPAQIDALIEHGFAHAARVLVGADGACGGSSAAVQRLPPL
jgi:hypothetical protein